MRYNKEFLYHFTCEKCLNWWSYPATTKIKLEKKTWICPHCSHEHKPPHINKADKPALTLNELRQLV